MSIIIGLNAYHPDSSACLMIDGKVVAAVAEERLGERPKHTDAFPINAIKWLLTSNNLFIDDIDQIAVARDPRANRFNKFLYLLKKPEIAFKILQRFRTRNSVASNELEK